MSEAMTNSDLKCKIPDFKTSIGDAERPIFIHMEYSKHLVT